MNANINPALKHFCVDIKTLKPDPHNVRKHGMRNLQAIAESLMRYGQQKPIVVKAGIVIAGNGTLEAAIRLGWEQIAATEFSGDGKAQGYALADNRTAELAEWDFEALSNQLSLFEDQLELQALWSPEELSALQTNLEESGADPVGLSPEAKKAIFDANIIKQIVLYFEEAQYKSVLERFRKIAEVNKLETNTDVVVALLEFYERGCDEKNRSGSSEN